MSHQRLRSSKRHEPRADCRRAGDRITSKDVKEHVRKKCARILQKARGRMSTTCRKRCLLERWSDNRACFRSSRMQLQTAHVLRNITREPAERELTSSHPMPSYAFLGTQTGIGCTMRQSASRFLAIVPSTCSFQNHFFAG